MHICDSQRLVRMENEEYLLNGYEIFLCGDKNNWELDSGGGCAIL